MRAVASSVVRLGCAVKSPKGVQATRHDIILSCHAVMQAARLRVAAVARALSQTQTHGR